MASSTTTFAHIPWCKSLLDDPEFSLASPYTPKFPGYNSFWFELIASNKSIRAQLHLYRSTSLDLPESSREVRILLDHGYQLSGQAGICHGGFLATLADEAGGAFLRIYGYDNSVDPRTAYLNVSYRKAVATPGVMLLKVRMLSRQGRKMFLEVRIMDAAGDVCVLAEILYITSKQVSM
jgi:acyl-coenzyme A thioesterase PaaI-like protein